MKSLMAALVTLPILIFTACSPGSSQDVADTAPKVIVGGPCEGCAGIFESPVPLHELSWIDTLPDFLDAGPKIMISGTIFKADGHTPAKDVVLFIYHTDQAGRYSNKYNEQGWSRRQGYIRGWMKTNARGEYKFYTLLPASYPNSQAVKHIHPTILEPGKNEYWIDEFVFDDDPFLTAEQRKKHERRGGDGIIKLTMQNGILCGQRNIYLGKNIPDYPVTSSDKIQSGLETGENCPAFDPLHFSGADKGKKTCPMCKYGSGQGVMIWFNHSELNELNGFVDSLEKLMTEKEAENFRVFLMYMNPGWHANDDAVEKMLQEKISKWSEEQHLKKVALVWVLSPVDPETCGIYKINPLAKNTVLAYKKRKVIVKWINMEYTAAAVKKITNAMN